MEHLLEAWHVARGVLRANDARAIQRQAFEHWHADLVGEGRDVVNYDVDRRFCGQFTEVGFNAVLRELVVIRTGNRDGPASEVGTIAAHLKDEVHIRFRSPSENRFSSGFFSDDGHDPLTLFVAEPDEFAHAAVRIKPRDAFAPDPSDDSPQLLLIDAAAGVIGDDIWDKDS